MNGKWTKRTVLLGISCEILFAVFLLATGFLITALCWKVFHG